MSTSHTRHHCTQCGQSFSRNEHLRRHQTKHEPSRPYHCRTCSMSFSRGDVLKRHELIHQPIDEAESGHGPSCNSGQKRTRAQMACDTCARAKIRCVGGKPCEQCTTKGIPCKLDRSHHFIRRRYPTLPRPGPGDTYHSDDRDSSTTSNGYIALSELPQSSFTLMSDSPEPNLVVSDLYQSSQTSSSSYPGVADQTTNLVPFQANDGSISATTFTMHDPPNLDIFDGSWTFPWNDLSMPLQDTSTLYDLKLLQNSCSLTDNFLFQSNGPESRTTRAPDDVEHQDQAISVASQNLYANYPFFHPLKRGRMVKLEVICDFLHDSRSWKQICVLQEPTHAAEVLVPSIAEGVRDSVSSKVHSLVAKALEQDFIREIPHLFPPLETIQCIFRSFFHNFASLYPVVHPTTFFESTWGIQEPYADIPLLLSTLVVLGALVFPVSAARSFAIELGFLLRSHINETMTRDENQINDCWTMTASLLLTVFSAWSGNRRHIELAEAFRGCFTSIFTRRGYYTVNGRQTPNSQTKGSRSEWATWIARERDIRLGYVWYIVEQEISLLFCVPSTLTFTDMRSPMPLPDEIFFANSENDWRELMRMRRERRLQSPPSLAAFNWMFHGHDFFDRGLEVTPLQLRLLLCVIQTQVLQYSLSNRFTCLDDNHVTDGRTTSLTAGSLSLLRLEELQNMLVKWAILRQRVLVSVRDSPTVVSMTLIYHLISLELFISYHDVQLIAGKEGFEAAKPLIPQLRRWAKSASAFKAIAHAGQIVKLLQCRDNYALRPIWWPAAVSRVALLMWAYSVGNQAPSTSSDPYETTAEMHRSVLISLNNPDEDLGTYGKVVQPGEGLPCLSDSNGQLVPLQQHFDIISLCLGLLDLGKDGSSPMCESVLKFLLDIRRWGEPYANV